MVPAWRESGCPPNDHPPGGPPAESTHGGSQGRVPRGCLPSSRGRYGLSVSADAAASSISSGLTRSSRSAVNQHRKQVSSPSPSKSGSPEHHEGRSESSRASALAVRLSFSTTHVLLAAFAAALWFDCGVSALFAGAPVIVVTVAVGGDTLFWFVVSSGHGFPRLEKPPVRVSPARRSTRQRTPRRSWSRLRARRRCRRKAGHGRGWGPAWPTE